MCFVYNTSITKILLKITYLKFYSNFPGVNDLMVCNLTTSPHLNKCWPRSLTSYDKINFNTFRPRQNGQYFADIILKCILLNRNIWIAIKTSSKSVSNIPIVNKQPLVQIMAWWWRDENPLSSVLPRLWRNGDRWPIALKNMGTLVTFWGSLMLYCHSWISNLWGHGPLQPK